MKTMLHITSETDAATITAEGTTDEIDALIEMYMSEGFDVEIIAPGTSRSDFSQTKQEVQSCVK